MNEPFGVVPGVFTQGQAIVNFAGTDPDDAKALQALGAAIASSPAQSPAWSGLHDTAADDAAKARAELVCRTMTCDVGRPGTPPTAFSTASVTASPSDSSLQPLAIAARPAGTPVGEPPTDRCATQHAGTVKDPIPMECLVDLPKRPTDCELVANQIRAGELAQGAYANAANVEKWSKLTISQYAQQSQWAAEDAIAAGMPTVKSGSPSSGGGGDGDKIGRLNDTDMDSCTPSETADAAGLTPIERQAVKAREAGHVVTCTAWKTARARGAKPDPEMPRSRGGRSARLRRRSGGAQQVVRSALRRQQVTVTPAD